MTDQTALLLSGSGRYADPWHSFPRTSGRLADLLSGEGLSVDQPDDIDDAVAGFASGPLPRLIVADLGRPQDGLPAPATATGRTGLRRLVENRPLLAVHAAASSFCDSPSWAAAVGARWVPGVSWHPERGPLIAHAAAASTSPLGVLESFGLDDERYLDLQEGVPDRTVLYEHAGENSVMQPSIWLQERKGIRSAYDAYGHDKAAYSSSDHSEIIRRVIRWLIHP